MLKTHKNVFLRNSGYKVARLHSAAAARMRFSSGILPWRIAVVGQSHVSDTEVVEAPQNRQTAINGMSRLNPQHAANLALLGSPFQTLDGSHKLQVVGVSVDKSFEHIQLLIKSGHSIFELALASHIH